MPVDDEPDVAALSDGSDVVMVAGGWTTETTGMDGELASDALFRLLWYCVDEEEDDEEWDDDDLAGEATVAVLILFLHIQQHHENSCSLASESEMGGL